MTDYYTVRLRKDYADRALMYAKPNPEWWDEVARTNAAAWPMQALKAHAIAAVLRAREDPLRVLADDEMVVSRGAAERWWDGCVSQPPPTHPARALYDELAPQLTSPRPPVEVGQVRRAPTTGGWTVLAIHGDRVWVARYDDHHIEPLAEVETWEVVE